MRSREPLLVIEFQGASLGAPPAALVGERTTATVALEDLALDRVGNVARTRFVGVFGRHLSRLPARGEALLLDVLHLGLQVRCRAAARSSARTPGQLRPTPTLKSNGDPWWFVLGGGARELRSR